MGMRLSEPQSLPVHTLSHAHVPLARHAPLRLQSRSLAHGRDTVPVVMLMSLQGVQEKLNGLRRRRVECCVRKSSRAYHLLGSRGGTPFLRQQQSLPSTQFRYGPKFHWTLKEKDLHSAFPQHRAAHMATDEFPAGIGSHDTSSPARTGPLTGSFESIA